MQVMKKRLLGVLAAVVLAALGTLVLVAYVQGAENRALAGEQTVDVLVVAQAIERSTKAEEIGPFVTTERVPLKVRAEGSVESLDELSGQVAAVDLLPGEQIVAARFQSPAKLAEESQVEVPDGLQEITIALEPQRAVGGQIAPGDTVGIFASFSPDVLPYNTKLILHKLLLTNIQMEQLPPSPSEEDAASSAPELAPTGNLLMTLAVDVTQAERIVFAAEHGTIWLSAEPESANEGGSQLRNPENIYND
jgi:pilus assembly protein CpaB